MRGARTSTITAARRSLLLAGICLAGLLTAAYAATGRFPLGAPSRGGTPAVTLVPLGGMAASDESGAGMRVAAMRPGSERSGEARVTNSGRAPGALSLSTGARVDAPADLREPLSAVLELAVVDVGASPPLAVYRGSLAGLGTVSLGTWAPREQHRYRFTVRYPVGRSDAADNALQGATSALTWSFVAVGGLAPVAGSTVTRRQAPLRRSVSHRRSDAPRPAVLRVRNVQRLWRRALRATVWCRTACRGEVRATLTITGRVDRVRLNAVAVRLRHGHRRGIRLVATPRAARVARGALRSGAHVRVRVVWRVRVGGATRRVVARTRVR